MTRIRTNTNHPRYLLLWCSDGHGNVRTEGFASLVKAKAKFAKLKASPFVNQTTLVLYQQVDCEETVRAKIVKPPKLRRVKCKDCRATIEYLPEEVEERHGQDYSGGPDGYKRVKCPRPGCKGHGYIERW